MSHSSRSVDGLRRLGRNGANGNGDSSDSEHSAGWASAVETGLSLSPRDLLPIRRSPSLTSVREAESAVPVHERTTLLSTPTSTSTSALSVDATKCRLPQLASALFYGAMAMSLLCTNKILYSTYHLKYPIPLLACQLFASIVILLASHMTNFIPVKLPPPSLSVVQQMIPVTAFFLLNVICGLYGLVYLSLPLFSTVRRTTTLFVVVCEKLLLNVLPPPPALVAIVFITLGSFLAGASDLYHTDATSSQLLGYGFAFGANLFSTLYLVYFKSLTTPADPAAFPPLSSSHDRKASSSSAPASSRLVDVVTAFVDTFSLRRAPPAPLPLPPAIAFSAIELPSHVAAATTSISSPHPDVDPSCRGSVPAAFDSSSVLFYNSLLSLPFVVVLGYAAGNVQCWAAVQTLLSGPRGFSGGCFLLFFTIQAVSLNMAMLLCTSLNTATTTTVVGQMKDVLMLAVSIVLFDDFVFHPLTVFGIFLSLGSSVWYSLLMLRDRPRVS